MKPRADGKIDLTLSLTHRRFLLLIAERHEVPYDYAKVTRDVGDHIRKLVEMRLIEDIQIIRDARAFSLKGTCAIFRLTSMGTNIVDQIKKAGG
jgi:hypothetical protein